ncbi:dimethylsulfoxide reductase subunit B [Desulfovibrio sp. OttesenSCG-928-G15]|nr:dimethylsulfoxide reductase subunit B [Desulfovibrio sp. OttesenSCG-928-G15]
MLQNPAFYCNSELCTGCKTCMIACKDKHNLGKGQNWRKVVEYCGGGFTPTGNGAFTHNVFAYYISFSCNHCENPACTKSCPTKAIRKDENGIVCIDPQQCEGCRSCEWSCPYTAPQFDEESGKMSKCDFCKDYLKEEMPPACVAACPCRALDFGEYEDLRKKYGEYAPIAPLPSPELTRPHFLCAPNRQAKALGTTFGTRGALISNPQEI